MEVKFNARHYGKTLTVDLDLRGRRTLISGASGTGKTFIRKLATKNTNNIVGLGYDDIQKVGFLYDDQKHAFSVSDKVIVIDDAENLFLKIPGMIEAINYDCRNYFIIFIRKAVGLRATPGNVGELCYDDEDNKITIKYRYPKGLWADD